MGCVPKKFMFMASQAREAAVGPVATAAGYGLSMQESRPFDWAGFKQRRDAHLQKLNGFYLQNWAKAGVEVVTGIASFVDKTTVHWWISNCADTARWQYLLSRLQITYSRPTAVNRIEI